MSPEALDKALARVMELEGLVAEASRTSENLKSSAERANRQAISAAAEAEQAKAHARELAWVNRKLGLELKKLWKRELGMFYFGRAVVKRLVNEEVADIWEEEVDAARRSPLPSALLVGTEKDWKDAEGDMWLRRIGYR